MAVYFKHTCTVTRNILYQFVCEHCHQDSGILAAEFKAEGTRTLMTKRPLTGEEKAQLDQEASERLHKRIQDAMQASDNEDYADSFNDKCPQCGNPQSWALKGMRYLPGSYALTGAFFTALLCLGINFLGLTSFSLKTGVIAILAVALLGVIVGFTRIQLKSQRQKLFSKRSYHRFFGQVKKMRYRFEAQQRCNSRYQEYST